MRFKLSKTNLEVSTLKTSKIVKISSSLDNGRM